MHVLLVVNPRATRVRAGVRERVAAALAERHEVEVAVTAYRGHAGELAGRAASEGMDLVAVLGGDGTLNEVVNGLAGAGADLPVGLLAGGKANVVPRGLGLPGKPLAATARLLELLERGDRRRVSLGEADGRRFVFSAGMGLDAAVVRQAERWRAALERRGAGALYGNLLWVVAGLRVGLLGYERRQPRLTARLPDGPTLTGFFAMVAKADPYTWLGPLPFRPLPQASFEGGLDLLVGRTMAPAVLLRALASMLSRRPRNPYPALLPTLHDRPGVILEASVPLPVQVDGEYLGERTSLRVRQLPRALTLVAPPAPGGAHPGGR